MTNNNGLREDLLANTFEALAVGSDAFVAAQEARGQDKLVHSELLPSEGDWKALEALGFVKGEQVEGDDLFVHASIPEGWVKERTSHSLYTVIKDERGIERVRIGYKAAFYDRWARISVMKPGVELALFLRFGDEMPKQKPADWDLLTNEERAEAFDYLESQISDAQEARDRREKSGRKDDYFGPIIARDTAVLELLRS